VKLDMAFAMGIVVVATAACGDDDTASTDTAYVAGTTVAATNDAAYAYATTDPLVNPFYLALQEGAGAASTSSSGPDQAATAAANAAGHYFTPSSCVMATAKGSDVTYNLNSCSGPLGITDVSGMLSLSFSSASGVSDGGIAGADAGTSAESASFTLNSTGLTINGEGALISSHGSLKRIGTDQKQVTLSSMSEFTHKGQKITNDSSSTISWTVGSQCIDMTSTGKVSTGFQTFNLKISGFRRCAAACPTKGTVRLTDSKTVTLTLDGTSMPTYTSSDGTSGVVDLDCRG
jgi:hypothetical protein